MPEDLRRHRWYGAQDLRSFGPRSRTAGMGYAPEDYRGKPVIAIVNTWSDEDHAVAALGSGPPRRKITTYGWSTSR